MATRACPSRPPAMRAPSQWPVAMTMGPRNAGGRCPPAPCPPPPPSPKGRGQGSGRAAARPTGQA